MQHVYAAIMMPDIKPKVPLRMNYLPMLRRLVSTEGKGRSSVDIDVLITLLQTLMVSAEPLTQESCEKLVGLGPEEMQVIINGLHPFVKVKSRSGILKVCPLFREYLLSKPFADDKFHLNEEESHATLAALCLSEMVHPSASTKLRKFPPQVQYACTYVMHHIKHSRDFRSFGLTLNMSAFFKNTQAVEFWTDFYQGMEMEGNGSLTLRSAAQEFKLLKAKRNGRNSGR